jgi:cytochrome P450
MVRAKFRLEVGGSLRAGTTCRYTNACQAHFQPSFVPEGTQIYIPPYAIHRRAEYFHPSPEKFDPDRWLRDENCPGEVLNLTAFIPFSYGAANCVGKSLAWREMLMVASTLMKKFDFRFADGFRSESWPDELHDVFVTSIGAPLLVTISSR